MKDKGIRWVVFLLDLYDWGNNPPSSFTVAIKCLRLTSERLKPSPYSSTIPLPSPSLSLSLPRSHTFTHIHSHTHTHSTPSSFTTSSLQIFQMLIKKKSGSGLLITTSVHCGIESTKQPSRPQTNVFDVHHEILDWPRARIMVLYIAFQLSIFFRPCSLLICVSCMKIMLCLAIANSQTLAIDVIFFFSQYYLRFRALC